MKILDSSVVSPFGGLNFVLKEAIDLNINNILRDNLPALPQQCKYGWFDIFMSYWSVFFCGGDCAEDLAINIKNGMGGNPYIKIPSPDRVLERIKSLRCRAIASPLPRDSWQAKRHSRLASRGNILN